jgi:hypothetical protein
MKHRIVRLSHDKKKEVKKGRHAVKGNANLKKMRRKDSSKMARGFEKRCHLQNRGIAHLTNSETHVFSLNAPRVLSDSASFRNTDTWRCKEIKYVSSYSKVRATTEMEGTRNRYLARRKHRHLALNLVWHRDMFGLSISALIRERIIYVHSTPLPPADAKLKQQRNRPSPCCKHRNPGCRD